MNHQCTELLLFVLGHLILLSSQWVIVLRASRLPVTQVPDFAIQPPRPRQRERNRNRDGLRDRSLSSALKTHLGYSGHGAGA